MDVALVQMPLAPVQSPSLGLGLIHALLQRDGIEVKTFYANLWFLEYAGAIETAKLNLARAADSLVDWLFAGAAFPNYEVDHDQYLDCVMGLNANLGEKEPEAAKKWLWALRQRVPDFVDKTAANILSHRPRIVACTSMFQQHVASLALLRRVREQDPSVVTMMGGANCETVMGRATHRNFPWVDCVASGEVDDFIADLCRTLMRSGPNIPSAKLPPGVFGPVHREQGYPSGDTRDGLPRATTTSLEELPVPNYDDYFDELSRSASGKLILPAISFEMSRGCWWGKCTFCGLNACGERFRSKSSDQILRELELLCNRYPTTRIAVTDNALDMSYFDTLLPRLARLEKRFGFFFEIRPRLTRHQVEQLRAANMRWLNCGIESLHDEILTLIHKGTSVWQSIQMLKLCRQNGIFACWNMLFGFPGEKDEWYHEMAQLIPLLVHLFPPYFLVVRFCRYSTYVYKADDYGLKLNPSSLCRFAFPLDETELRDLVYHFEDENTPDDYLRLNNSSFPFGSGLEAVYQQVNRWRKLSDPENPLLQMRQVNGVTVVTDRRPCAVDSVHRISGLAQNVLELCDDAPTIQQLTAVLHQDRGATPSDVRQALADLLDRRLVLEMGSRVISLPLRDPVAELPKFSENPAGLFLVDAFHWSS